MVPRLNDKDRGGPVLNKAQQLKQDQELSQRIAEAGYDLVHRADAHFSAQPDIFMLYKEEDYKLIICFLDSDLYDHQYRN